MQNANHWNIDYINLKRSFVIQAQEVFKYLKHILLYDSIAFVIFLIFTFYQSRNTPNYITTNSGKIYTIKELNINSRLYIDRGYKFNNLADSLKGSVFIQTANDDKANNQQNLFSIIISDCIGSRVFFLFDKRIYSTQLYNWMPQKKFQEVHPLITSTDKDANYILYTYTITKEKDTLYIGGNQSVIDKKTGKHQKMQFKFDNFQRSTGRPYH